MPYLQTQTSAERMAHCQCSRESVRSPQSTTKETGNKQPWDTRCPVKHIHHPTRHQLIQKGNACQYMSRTAMLIWTCSDTGYNVVVVIVVVVVDGDSGVGGDDDGTVATPCIVQCYVSPSTYRVWVSHNASIYWVALGIVSIHDDACQTAQRNDNKHAWSIQQ